MTDYKKAITLQGYSRTTTEYIRFADPCLQTDGQYIRAVTITLQERRLSEA